MPRHNLKPEYRSAIVLVPGRVENCYPQAKGDQKKEVSMPPNIASSIRVVALYQKLNGSFVTAAHVKGKKEAEPLRDLVAPQIRFMIGCHY